VYLPFIQSNYPLLPTRLAETVMGEINFIKIKLVYQ